MRDLAELRLEIDRIDRQMVELFEQRMAVSEEVAQYKVATGKRILDREREIYIGKYRVLLTHGHYYNVSLGTEQITEDAKERGFDIVMFGHTHRPYLDDSQGIIVLNPGSLSYPRQQGRKPSYMIIELDESGQAHFYPHFLD